MIYEFMATQSFNGYDKPWAPGAGENKIVPKDAELTIQGVSVIADASLEKIIMSGTASSSGGRTKQLSDILPIPAGTYRYTRFGDLSVGVALNDSSKNVLVWANAAALTVEDDTEGFIGVNVTSGESYNGEIQIMLSEGSDVPTKWTPYSNICMPEGFNIWDPDNDEMIQIYAGYVNANTRELYLRPVYQEYAGEELVGPWMSSLDEYSEDATPTEGAFVIDFGGELTSYEITAFMLQTLLESLGIRQHFTNGAGLLNSLMDQAQGRVRSEEELLHLSRPLNVIAIGDQLPVGLTFKPISKDVLPGLPGKFIR